MKELTLNIGPIYVKAEWLQDASSYNENYYKNYIIKNISFKLRNTLYKTTYNLTYNILERK